MWQAVQFDLSPINCRAAVSSALMALWGQVFQERGRELWGAISLSLLGCTRNIASVVRRSDSFFIKIHSKYR